jgi:hypothetical protein
MKEVVVKEGKENENGVGRGWVVVVRGGLRERV